MAATTRARPRVHRTASIRLCVTRRQADRCYRLLRSGGDVWAWLIDTNRQRQREGRPLVVSYQKLCKELTGQESFGELSAVGARSILRRYSCAWFQAARRRERGEDAGFPRRKHALVPVSFHHGVFELDGLRVRLPMAKGSAELWVRLARPIPYPAEHVRAITLFSKGGLLWLSVTAAVPCVEHPLDPGRTAGVDLGIIHPYAVVTQHAGLLVSGRAIRVESWLHLHDRLARQAAVSRRAPKRGQHGSRRWRRYRVRERRQAARHHRRVRQAHHEAAKATACGRARQLLHVCGMSASGPQARHPTLSLSPLQVPRASGSRGCSQHRRHGNGRRKQRSTACADRAPSSRHCAGTA